MILPQSYQNMHSVWGINCFFVGNNCLNCIIRSYCYTLFTWVFAHSLLRKKNEGASRTLIQLSLMLPIR